MKITALAKEELGKILVKKGQKNSLFRIFIQGFG